MPPLPLISGREAVAAFERAGWIQTRQSGSHIILAKHGVATNLSVPDHRTVKRGTLRGLIRKSGMTVDEFAGML